MSRRLYIRCAVPSCSAEVQTDDPENEQLCDRHWHKCAGPFRDRYEAAWDEITRGEAAGILDDVEAAQRVCAAWEELKRHAIERFA